MAKAKKAAKKKGSKKNSSDKETDAPEVQKLISITNAEIKDGYCNFGYKILAGTGVGFEHKVKGKDVGLVLEDMTNAFQKFNAHFADIDMIFKHRGIGFDNIDEMHNNEFTADYEVDSFKIKGEEETIKVVLSGTKSVGVLGRISFSTPEIELGDFSSYKWRNELNEAVNRAKLEVELYNGGKYEPVHKEEEVDENQLTIEDQMNEGKDGSEQDIEFQEDESDASAKRV